MSQATKSAKTGPKLPTLPVYELLPPVSVVPPGVDPSTLLFPEWADADINAEKWDVPKGKPNPKVPEVIEKFNDKHIIRMPESLTEETWKRPGQIFVQCNVAIFSEGKSYSDLVSGSAHLLHSEFVRNFISAIGILNYLTDNRPSPIEFTTSTYVPTTEGIPWRPWHHIYSMCKGGKGGKHNPLVNQLGKYVVRLFWMGCWRKITIDDTLPIGHNYVLLPSLIAPSFTKQLLELTIPFTPNKTTTTIDLWPFLLSKALLKISNLTQTNSNELLDFDIIQCLTGWFPYKIEVLGIHNEDVWEMCAGYSDHYTWPEPVVKSSVSGSKSSKVTTLPNVLEDKSANIAPFHLIGVCSDMKEFKENVIPNVTPCWSHNFLIDQTRNIPLVKPVPLPELAPWKQFRWVDWAIKKGIWPKPDTEAIKSIKMVSIFKKRTDYIPFETASQESIDIQDNVLAKQMQSKQQNENTDKYIWVDFNEIAPYLNHLYLYFKLSRFKKVTRITNILQKDDGKDASKAKGAKAPVLPISKLLMWNNSLMCARNEPIYIFCDSVDYKLIVINLAQEGNVDVLTNKSATNIIYDVPFSYILIEDYNWQSQKISDIVISLRTYGNKTLLMEINPGRFVFRMWLKSEKSFFINIMSDSDIEIGSLEYVLEYMSHESERLMQFCDNVSSCYGQLVQKLGTPSYKDALKLFYKSYLPESTLTKAQLIAVHDIFMKELITMVNNVSSKEELKIRILALKVLFLNPKIDYDCNFFSRKMNSICEDTSNDDDTESIELKEKAVVVLQTAFRRFLVLRLSSMHNQKHLDHLKIFEKLKFIYNDIFSVSNRMVACANLVRHFLLINPTMIDISQEYALTKDLKSTIHLKHFVGSVPVCANDWIPINRYIFHCNSVEPTTIKIYLFSNLTKYMVRVFNNDTKKEIIRFTNNVIVNDYESNTNGYTVFCYGWSDFQGECRWKLNFVTVKTKSVITITVPDVRIVNNVIKQIYRPNVYNYICRCTVKIEHDVVLSFRLSTTYKDVELHLRCLNEAGEVLSEISGKTSVIIPFVLLYYVPASIDKRPIFHSTTSVTSKEFKSKTRLSSLKSKRRSSLDRKISKVSLTTDKSSIDDFKMKETTYFVEAFVVNDSWPLTKKEWQVVEEFKNKSLLVPICNDSQDDNLSNDYVLTEIDNRRQEEINNIKRAWYENGTDRYAKSKELREEFLKSHYIPFEPDILSLKENVDEDAATVSDRTTSLSEQVEDTTRTLVKPEDPFKTLPLFDVMEYVREEDLKLTTDSSDVQIRKLFSEVQEQLLNKQNNQEEEFDEYFKRYKEDMVNFLNDQSGKYKLLNDFFKTIKIPSDFRTQNEITPESEQACVDALDYSGESLEVSTPSTSVIPTVDTIDETKGNVVSADLSSPSTSSTSSVWSVMESITMTADDVAVETVPQKDAPGYAYIQQEDGKGQAPLDVMSRAANLVIQEGQSIGSFAKTFDICRVSLKRSKKFIKTSYSTSLSNNLTAFTSFNKYTPLLNVEDFPELPIAKTTQNNFKSKSPLPALQKHTLPVSTQPNKKRKSISPEILTNQSQPMFSYKSGPDNFISYNPNKVTEFEAFKSQLNKSIAKLLKELLNEASTVNDVKKIIDSDLEFKLSSILDIIKDNGV
ncbi:hypothetical protein RN001_004428 [Aquatica leii]|uniref:Calpain catalytic domain-containing protein n=1 Tax=Aquatica leii TaxID=1421715 RepID=A0AAN7PBC4_9COLE|nr:hypothetical protein RN001_004428 [Aquatica leii]